jgi:hypothetical protein
MSINIHLLHEPSDTVLAHLVGMEGWVSADETAELTPGVFPGNARG